MSIEHTIRKMGWDRNKRTQGVPPRVDEASLKKARELHSAGEYEAALQLLENIKECPNDARAVRVAGLCCLGLDRVDDAIQLFLLARELSQLELSWDEINLSVGLLVAKRFDEALATAKRAVALAPLEPGGHVNVIATLARSGDTPGRDAYLEKLIEEYPEVIASAFFKDRLSRDPDFMGVREILDRLTNASVDVSRKD
ncbi:tetratricopeptide repeat protein [Bradyrhizobium barranii]